MPSPFPGMDPYFETHWDDVHTSIATYTRDLLNKQLPGPLRARIHESVSVEADDERTYVPDVRVRKHPGPEVANRPGVGDLIATEPVVLPMYSSPRTQRSVHVKDTSAGDRLVTVIEILSPADKVGLAGRKAYRRKQSDLLGGRVSLVEIDLIRVGKHAVAVPATRFPKSARTPYRVCVVRGWATGRGEVYPISLRERLPVVRVPLRQTDPDALIDLQTVMNDAYERGSYDGLDHRDDPDPPLGEQDAAWADGLLKAAGKR